MSSTLDKDDCLLHYPGKWKVAIISSAIFLSLMLFTNVNRIINDVVFNKHPTLADIKAVQDAKQSLTNMIRDFLQEFQ